MQQTFSKQRLLKNDSQLFINVTGWARNYWLVTEQFLCLDLPAVLQDFLFISFPIGYYYLVKLEKDIMFVYDWWIFPNPWLLLVDSNFEVLFILFLDRIINMMWLILINLNNFLTSRHIIWIMKEQFSCQMN